MSNFIKQFVKTTRKTVMRLTDAEPRFVSLVQHGANQTPFAVVKADRIENQPYVEDQEDDMPIKKNEAGLVSIEFSADQFETAEAAKAWMEEKGFAVDGDIEEIETGFKFTADGELEEKAQEIEADIGVTYKVALIEEDEDDKEDIKKAAKKEEPKEDEPEAEADDAEEADDEEDAEKSAEKVEAELTKKLDMFNAYMSDKGSLSQIMNEADDGFPMGGEGLVSLFVVALENNAKKGDMDGVKRVAGEFGEMFTKMMKATQEMIEMGNYDEEKGNDEKVAEEAEKEADEVTDEDDAGEDAPEAEADAKEEQDEIPSDEDEDEATEPEEAEKADAGKEADNEVVDALKSTMTGLEEAIKSIADSTKQSTEAIQAVQGELSSVTKRVNELESVEQTRKGADDEVAAQDTPKTTSWKDDPLQRNVWGFRRDK